MAFDLSHHEKGKEVRLWIPYPVSDRHQDISNISFAGDYTEVAVYTDKVFKTPMLFARWEKSTASRDLTFSFDAKRAEVSRPKFPAQQSAVNSEEFAPFLSATQLGPIDGDVKALAERITQGKTSVLEKAKSIYDWTVENTYRDPDTRGCGRGDVRSLLKDPGGKCTDISSLYVALARAAGVPAREVFGIRMGKKEAQDITTWHHCWAEFFLPGHGWVSIDPADVRKMMLVQNVELSDPKTAACRDYFLGGIDPYRIRLGEGRDVILNPAQQGKPVNYLMYPFAQVDGKTLDWLDPATFKYTITFKRAGPLGERREQL